MLAKLPMLIAVRGIQPGKSDPIQPPCGRCSGVGVRLQVSGPYEILQATVEIRRGSVHAEALGRCHRVHATACRGVPQLPSHRLQQLHALGAHVTSRTPSSTTAFVRSPEPLLRRRETLPSEAPPRPSQRLPRPPVGLLAAGVCALVLLPVVCVSPYRAHGHALTPVLAAPHVPGSQT